MVRPKRTHFKFKQMRFVHKLCPALLLLHVGDVYIVVIAEEELLGRTSAASEGRILFQDPTFFAGFKGHVKIVKLPASVPTSGVQFEFSA